MTRSERCEACDVPAPDERVVGGSRDGHVGHEGSERRLWLCASCYGDAAVRERVVRKAFGDLMEERRGVFKPRSEKEAKELERRDNQRAGYGTPSAAREMAWK